MGGAMIATRTQRPRQPRGKAVALCLLGALVIVCARPSTAALPQAADTTFWMADGGVRAMVRAGGTIYIGGEFRMLAPATGCGAPLSRLTSDLVRPFPKVRGVITAIAPDD